MSIRRIAERDKCKRVRSGCVSIVREVGGAVAAPTIRLSENHPCKGCVWYARDTDVLYCPFPNCIRKK